MKDSLCVKAIYRNKYTAAVGFDFAQPTEKSRVERTRVRLQELSKLPNTGIFFLGNHLNPWRGIEILTVQEFLAKN